MGMHVAAIDISNDKLDPAITLGADLVVNAMKQDPREFLKKETGGMHGVLVTAASLVAFRERIS